jgi:ABC-type methionine transport system ATPase subunit
LPDVANRVIFFDKGVIVEQGEAKAFAHPKEERTKQPEQIPRPMTHHPRSWLASEKPSGNAVNLRDRVIVDDFRWQASSYRKAAYPRVKLPARSL